MSELNENYRRQFAAEVLADVAFFLAERSRKNAEKYIEVLSFSAKVTTGIKGDGDDIAGVYKMLSELQGDLNERMATEKAVYDEIFNTIMEMRKQIKDDMNITEMQERIKDDMNKAAKES